MARDEERHTGVVFVQPIRTKPQVHPPRRGGDAFMAGLLAGLHYARAFEVKKGGLELLEKLGSFTNLVVGLSVTRRGHGACRGFERVLDLVEFLRL